MRFSCPSTHTLGFYKEGSSLCAFVNFVLIILFPAIQMKTKENFPAGYKAMWLFAMFDLPTDTKRARRDYTRFRKKLLNEGFIMMQFSVYARYCAGEEIAAAHRRRVRGELPADGEVRLVTITDKQFGKMEVYWGKKREPTEKPTEQLLLF